MWLTERGLNLGFLTKCTPDVPRLWSQTEFADLFDHRSFFSLTGSVKPDAAIYEDALDGLGVDPGHVLYVGDGSDQEMTGARAVGMEPVLVSRDLSNTYDVARKDVDEWEGRAIGGIDEVHRPGTYSSAFVAPDIDRTPIQDIQDTIPPRMTRKLSSPPIPKPDTAR